MPVDLTNIEEDLTTTDNNTPNFRPSFFYSALTGKGLKQGAINEELNPGKISTTVSEDTNYGQIDRFFSSSSNQIKTHYIPFDPIIQSSLPANRGIELPLPDFELARQYVDPNINPKSKDHNNSYLIGTKRINGLDYEVFLRLTTQSLIHIQEGSKVDGRTIKIQYKVEFYFVSPNNGDNAKLVTDPIANINRQSNPTNYVMLGWSFNPLRTVENVVRTKFNMYVDDDDLKSWMSEYSAYKAICEQATKWNDHQLGSEVTYILDQLAVLIDDKDAKIDDRIARQIAYLESYTVTLDDYKKIFNTLKKHFSANHSSLLNTISNTNVNMLMINSLGEFEATKPNVPLPHIKGASFYKAPNGISKQQLEAVTAEGPYNLIQAGAGTGKSKTIMWRLDWLKQCGVKEDNVLAITFTNAAADNLTARAAAANSQTLLVKDPNDPSNVQMITTPGGTQIKSMTIARMIMDIYSLNYPTHELSSTDTVVNCIEISFPNNSIASRLAQLLMACEQNKERNSFTSLNSFVEKNFDEVIKILDRISQTTLMLTSIICYQKIDQLIEPDHLQVQYLIIDEVQDNSIFEFIYVLKYSIKHKLNLYIVGDSSQTLFEFRNSNPKALNALESSGVFDTFRLTTNYRSNQEVLDLANSLLKKVEANQFAKIQLQSNTISTVTKQSYEEKVKFVYERVARLSDFKGAPSEILQRKAVKEYIDKCLAKGEQVAVLAYSGRTVKEAQEALEELYPTEIVANLVPDKVPPFVGFSNFIKLYWNDVLQVEPKHAAFTFDRQARNLSDKIIPHATDAKINYLHKMLTDWWLQNNANINSWIRNYESNPIPANRDWFFRNLSDCIIQFEIRKNAIRNTIVSSANNTRREEMLAANPKLLVSTIHSAKGREFDNTIVFMKVGLPMPEEDKRMYYVALTRAMHTTYVHAYGTINDPEILMDYNNRLKELEEEDKLRQQHMLNTSQNITPDGHYDASHDEAVHNLKGIAAGEIHE